MWEPLIKALSERDYRVVAFDQRGYSTDFRPKSVEQYRVDLLVADVFDVADILGFETFHLVGHDWGAGIGWSAALADKQRRILSWSALSVPHPAAFAEALTNNPDQQSSSGYFALFKLPWLAESLFAFNRFGLLRQIYAVMDKAHQQEYLALFSERGAMTSALNWYRAIELADPPEKHDIEIPVLFIWGTKDFTIARSTVDSQEKYLSDFQKIELDTGHWLMEEETAATTSAVLSFIDKQTEFIGMTP